MFFLGAFAKLRKTAISFALSVFSSFCLSSWNNSAHHWTEYHGIRYMQIFRKSILKIQVLLKSEKNNGYLHEKLCKFMIIFLLILVTMRNVSDKVCRENQNTYSMFNNFFFPKIVPVTR